MEMHHLLGETPAQRHLPWQPMDKAQVAACPSPLLPVVGQGYRICPLAANHRDPAIGFLRRFFFRDEPLNQDVGLLDSDDGTCEELEQYCLGCMDEGSSLIALSPLGEVVGVCLNGEGEAGHLAEMEADASSCSHPAFRKILGLLTHIERHADVYGRFPGVGRVAEVRIVSVGDDWRGRGVATALIHKSREQAIQRGYSLLRIDCTSHFTARAACRLGLVNIYSLPYAQYRDGQGRPVFGPPLPHTTAATYVQRLLPPGVVIEPPALRGQSRQ